MEYYSTMTRTNIYNMGEFQMHPAERKRMDPNDTE